MSDSPPVRTSRRPWHKYLKSLERVKGIEPSSSAWKAVALPLSYTRFEITEDGGRMSTRAICPPSSSVLYPALGGGGRTRTYEGVSQRIYSPPPLPLGSLPRIAGS